MKIGLKAAPGTFGGKMVSAREDQLHTPLQAVGEDWSDEEHFDVLELSLEPVEALEHGHSYALRYNGLYVCADLDLPRIGPHEGIAVVANRSKVGPWETWKYESMGSGSCAWKNVGHGLYLTSEVETPDAPVTVRSEIAKGWQVFGLQTSVPASTTDLLRGDFLCAENEKGDKVNSGEYPALSEEKQSEILGIWDKNKYNTLYLESDWPGDDHVPAFSWTDNPKKFLASIPEILAASIKPALVIGLEGFGGRHVNAAYIKKAKSLAKKAQAAGVEIMVIGIECEEFTNYTTEYRPLVAAVKPFAKTLLTAFHGGVLAHPGDRVGSGKNAKWTNTPTVKQFWSENRLDGLMYQFDKRAVHGSFLVPDSDLVAQLQHARARLPILAKLHAGEYAYGVSEIKAQHAGDVCAAWGFDTWNGVGLEPIAPITPVPDLHPDSIPIDHIHFTNQNGDCSAMIRSFKRDGNLLSAKVSGNRISFPNTASGRWTLTNSGILGSCWEIARVKNVWLGRTFDDIESFRWDKDWTGGSSFKPDPGTQLHFMITGPARRIFDGEQLRTNIMIVS